MGNSGAGQSTGYSGGGYTPPGMNYAGGPLNSGYSLGKPPGSSTAPGFMTKEMGQDGGVLGPDGTPAPAPGVAAPPATAPGGAPAPAAGQPSAPTSQGMNLWQPGGFMSTPFMQQFGGQPAPYHDLTAQTLDSFLMHQNGAGRFGSNNAQRYGFAGGSQFRPDTMGYGAATPNRYAPQAPLTPPPMRPATGGMDPRMGGGPPTAGQNVGGGNQMAQFQQMLATSPQLAKQAMDKDVPWFMNNKAGIEQALGKYGYKDLAAFRNANDPASANIEQLNAAQNAQLAQFGRRY